MTRLNILTALFILIVSTHAAALCGMAETRLISEQAEQHGLPSEYMLAIARVVSDCDPAYTDRKGRVGLMAVNPDLLGPPVAEDPEWLFYPSVNARAAARLLRDLQGEYSDWETVLTVYLQGNTRASSSTRHRIQSIFRLAHGPNCALPRRGCPDLDDFGPRCRPAGPCLHEQGRWQPLYGRNGRIRRW